MELLKDFNEDEMKQIIDYIATEKIYIAWEYYDYCRGCQTLIPFQDHKPKCWQRCSECERLQCPQCFPKWADFSGEHFIFNEWPYHVEFVCLICLKEVVDEVREYTIKRYGMTNGIWDVIYNHLFEKVGDDCYIQL